MPNEFNEVIFETKFWIVELGYKQAYLGRSVIILKREVLHLSDLTEKEALDFLGLLGD